MNPKFCEWTNWYLLAEYRERAQLLSHDRDASSYRFTFKELEDEILARMRIGVQ